MYNNWLIRQTNKQTNKQTANKQIRYRSPRHNKSNIGNYTYRMFIMFIFFTVCTYEECLWIRYTFDVAVFPTHKLCINQVKGFGDKMFYCIFLFNIGLDITL